MNMTIPESHGRRALRLAARAALLAPTLLASGAAWAVRDLACVPAVRQMDLQPPVTKIASEVQWLHNGLMLICLVIFIAVFGVMFYSILKHRKSVGHKPANFHESTAVEIAWTAVPFLIVSVLGLLATRTVVAMKDTSNADVTIKATGYQWKWGYDYLNGEGAGISFLSTRDLAQRQASDAGKPIGDDYLFKVDNPLVVPVDRKIRIITTSADVIHAWMVPSFAVKQDAIPGFVRDTWFRAEKVGDYYGQCAELCGKEHAYMPIHVKVLSQADYAAWVQVEMKKIAARQDDPSKVWTMGDLQARGAKVYDANCAVCHKPDGKGGGPIKPLDGSAMVLDPDRSKQIMTVLHGVGNGAMPAWKALSDTDLAAVITYTKNHWSNKTGVVVQPSDVAAVRAGKQLAGTAPPATGPASPSADQTPAAAPSSTSAASGTAAAPAGNPDTPAPGGAASAAAALPASVFFAVGKADLDAKAQGVIADAVAFLKAHPQAKLALSGFVDPSGGAQLNHDLAKARAQAVQGALQKAGIDPARVELRKPSDIEANNADASKARRVELLPV